MSDILDDERPSGLPLVAIAARPIVEAVAHVPCEKRLAAVVAHDRRIEIVAAFLVSKDQRRLAARESVVTPA